MKIIAICNQKGGVGKTTTTVNMAAQYQSGVDELLDRERQELREV